MIYSRREKEKKKEKEREGGWVGECIISHFKVRRKRS